MGTKKLIQYALAPSKEVLKTIQDGIKDELSTSFTNMADSAFEYAMNNPTQLMDTTKERCSVRIMPSLAIFRISIITKANLFFVALQIAGNWKINIVKENADKLIILVFFLNTPSN